MARTSLLGLCIIAPNLRVKLTRTTAKNNGTLYFEQLALQVLRVAGWTLTQAKRKTQVWNKRTDEPTSTARPQGEPVNQQREPAPTPVPVQSAPPPRAPLPSTPAPTNGARQQAVIGPSMAIKGEIRAREELLVDGEVEGQLESQSLLTVGANGKVRGDIKAREVAIFGSVRGNVIVTEKIAIREQGSLIGDIKSAGISIDDGAYFKGSIDIIRPEPKASKAVQGGRAEAQAS